MEIYFNSTFWSVFFFLGFRALFCYVKIYKWNIKIEFVEQGGRIKIIATQTTKINQIVKKELYKESANLFSKSKLSIPEEIDKIIKTEFSESSFGNINNALECENQKLKENLAIELSLRKELEEIIDRLSSENQKIEQQQRNFKEISEQKSNTFISTINSLKQYCVQQNNNIHSDHEQYKKLISKILKESN